MQQTRFSFCAHSNGIVGHNHDDVIIPSLSAVRLSDKINSVVTLRLTPQVINSAENNAAASAADALPWRSIAHAHKLLNTEERDEQAFIQTPQVLGEIADTGIWGIC